MGQDVRINLLVSRKKGVLWTGTGFWVVLFVLLSYLVMIGMGYRSYEDRQQAEWEHRKLVAKLETRENAAFSGPNVRGFQQEVQTKSKKIRGLRENRVLVTEVCREVTRIFPVDSTLTEFSIDAGDLYVKGEGRDYRTVASILGGFSRSSMFKGVQLVRCEETAAGGIDFSVKAELYARKNGE